MEKVSYNNKNFNLYVFLSSFARNLIEVFIGAVLYKNGFSIRLVILYYLFVNFISLLITPFFIKMSKKYSNRLLSLIGVLSFSILQIMLNYVTINLLYLIFIAFLFAVYRRGYWIARRFYSLKVITKKNIAFTYSIISIVNQIAINVSAYVGSLLLDYISMKVLTTISITLFIISIIPLFKLKFEHEHNDEKIKLKETMKSIGFKDLYFFGSYELLNVIKFLFPLYIYIYIKNTYQTIGILALIVNMAIIIFSYIYGKCINKEKNFLKISILLVVVIYLCKANSAGILLYIISFLEGIITKMYEISINKNFFSLSKKYEYYNYNYVYELIQNIFRTFVVAILFFFVSDLKNMIYITLLFMIIPIFLQFNFNKKNDYTVHKDNLRR